MMNNYTKLIRIEYHGKLFDVFSSPNHNKVFLEVRCEDKEEKYYYCDIKDYIALNFIYNKKPDGVLYSRKYTFKDVVLLGGMYTMLTITSIHLGQQFYEQKIKLNKYESSQESVKYTKSETEDYCQEGYNIYIYNNDILRELGYEEVSFEEVRKTLESNSDIPFKYRKYIEDFINRLEERLPDVDLRIFNNNLKTLKFEIVDDNNWSQRLSDANAYYTTDTNTITVKPNYGSVEAEEAILFHEIGHTLNNARLIGHKDGQAYYLYKSFYDRNNGYGKSFSEGMNTILADYLLDDEVVLELYLSKEVRSFEAYQNISRIEYQILKLLSKDYTFYDYLNGNVSILESKLKELEIEDIIDTLDVKIDTESSDEVKANNQQLLVELQTKILEKRLSQQLKNQTLNDFEAYSLVYGLGCSSSNYEICNDFLNQNQLDWLIRIHPQEDIREVHWKDINVYKNDELLTTGNHSRFYIYALEEEEKVSYQLGYLDTMSNLGLIDSDKPEKNIKALKNLETDEVIAYSDTLKTINLKTVIDENAHSSIKCDYDVNLEILHSKQIVDYLDNKLNISTQELEIGKSIK